MNSLKLKRPKRKGYFYILKDGSHYKFGATTRDVNTRLSWAKSRTGYNYAILYTKLCKDVFKFEWNFKWTLNDLQTNYGFSPFDHSSSGEYFDAPEFLTPEFLVSLAEGIK
jgi:hypothetical protein